VSRLIYADVRLMIAPGGTGKTTLMLHEAICIALGLPLWGHDIGRPGTVVILTAEDSREMLTARLRSMAHAMNLAPEQAAMIMERVRLSDVSGLGFKLTVVEDDVVLPSDKIDMLIAGLIPLKPSMVVIDPAVSFGVGESRVNDAEQGLIEAARRLRNGLNCCVQYIHHTGKANARERSVDQYAGRGGSAFADGSRMVCVMAPIGRDEWLLATGQLLLEGEHAIRLALPKLSYCAPQQDILIRRTGYLFEHVERAENGNTAVLDANADMIYRLLISELKEERRHTRNTLEVVTSLKRADLRSAIHWLVASGRVLDKAFKRPGSRGGSRYLHPVVPGDESDPNEEIVPEGDCVPRDELVPGDESVAEEDYVPGEDSDGLGSPDGSGEARQGYAL